MNYTLLDSSLLSDYDDNEEHVLNCHHCKNRIIPVNRLKLRLLVAFGVCQVVLVLFAYLTYTYTFAQTHGADNGVDDYWKLRDYNVSATYGITDAADASFEAEAFWTNMAMASGVVTIDDEWAERMHLPPTLPNPDAAGQRIYLINVYHSMHCLYRIRNRLISDVPLTTWPRRDPHTMHCVDYIRKQLMCNADLDLYGTNDFITYLNHPQPAKCRDFDATGRWAKSHEWSGVISRLQATDAKKFEQLLWEDFKMHPGTHWDEYKVVEDESDPRGFRVVYLKEDKVQV